MRGNHQFDGGVGVGGHGAGLLSDDDFEAWITTLLEEDFDMTPIDFGMGGSNILDNNNINKKISSHKRADSSPQLVSNQNMVPKSTKPLEGLRRSSVVWENAVKKLEMVAVTYSTIKKFVEEEALEFIA
ncbi:hypothetical protein QJS10_CPA05g01755 [Acorus calamus]|uniref:Uncharacterized protein n=1 Tax=Acorus calamus TaxID=4465 RepID=A0AAV9EUW5_ACOCL|nr:hypothetical protein QJS10_CPA05g01755 [Acorus calamus]